MYCCQRAMVCGSHGNLKGRGDYIMRVAESKNVSWVQSHSLRQIIINSLQLDCVFARNADQRWECSGFGADA